MNILHVGSTNSMLAVSGSSTVTKKIKKSNESESNKQDICLLLLYEFRLKQEYTSFLIYKYFLNYRITN